MRVLLVKPYNLSDHIQPSLGLGYLAARIRHEHHVQILDCIKQGVTLDNFRDHIEEFRPDIVGFQTYTYDLPFVNHGVKIIKDLNPKIMAVVGGPHPSGTPESVFDDFKNIDAGFRGEAEISFGEYLNGKDCSEIPGLIYKTNKGVQINDTALVENLDELPMPAWDLIMPETYPQSQHGFFFKKYPIAPIMITRGCPYKCAFCAASTVSNRKLRMRSVDNVLNEILYLYNERGIREFHIVDDNFTMNKNYTIHFLKELKKMNLDISWATPNGVRMDSLNEEILDLMKETGLYLISLGIESGNDRVLKEMKKVLRVKDIEKYVSMIHNAKIDMAGFFILGYPTETIEEIKQTIKFSLELPLIRANYFTYLPFPGTESYNMLKSSGELDNVDWDNFYFMNAAYTPKGITRSELKDIQRSAFMKFYFRPKIFIKTVSSIRSLNHLYFFIKRFYHWLIMK